MGILVSSGIVASDIFAASPKWCPKGDGNKVGGANVMFSILSRLSFCSGVSAGPKGENCGVYAHCGGGDSRFVLLCRGR